MATEDRRIAKMFYLLSKTGGYLKSNELAQMLQLSERTVKGDMEQLKIFTRENGGSLESVRGKGYCLKAVDPLRFQQAKERVEILFSNIDKGHKENQVYHIARAVMRFEGADEEGYFRLEQLADRLYLSPSAIKKEMPGVRDFLGSFNLSLPARPGKGIRLAGGEFNRRLCLLELYENHFRKRVVTFRDSAYEQAFADRDDKDQIRRSTLEILRASDNEVFDIYVNRLVDYLLLLRNRMKDGHSLELQGDQWTVWKKEIQSCREYELARTLASELEHFPDFAVHDDEVTAIALLLLLWGDWDGVTGLAERFPTFYPQASRLSEEILEQLGSRWNIPIRQIDPEFAEKLTPGVLRILIQMHFNLSQCRLVGNSVSENAIQDSPVAMALADDLAEILCGICGKQINEYSIQLFAVSLYGLIDSISYPYIPRRILICARNGKGSAQAIADGICRRMGTGWIGKLTVSELYEARKYPFEDYDCLIGSFRPYAYRYSWPYTEVHPILQIQDYQRIYREILLKGYDLTSVLSLCSWDVVQVHKDFTANSIQAVLQLLAYQWGLDLACKERLAAYLCEHHRIRTHRQILTVLVPACRTGKQIFEVYLLKKAILYKGDNVKAVLFTAVDFHGSPFVLRYLEHAVRYLSDRFEDLTPSLSSKHLMDTLTEIIRNSL
ncbi:BglG family transcription antiterminator [Enterocloster lavalensis]|uniref:BglG family transcription antiterminator n=1 Tax=Enterocloster lavalensis TaxID=460384 RepID=UPI0023EF9CF9|nr:HTH domain-containing protein [Enterocloster lavalensis]